MASTSDLYRGAFLRFNGELCLVIEYEHRTPGNLRAFYQVKMRNVRSGKLIENRFRAGESLEFVRVEVQEFQFLYKSGENFVLMNNETYDQIEMNGDLFGDGAGFLKEGMVIQVSMDDEKPVYAELPAVVELEVTYTEPGIRGDTATKTLKPATVETGAKISVPLFVETGDRIRVDPRSGEYLERAK